MSNTALSNTSQLLLRNGEWLKSDRLLLVGMPADDLGRTLLSEQVAPQVYGLSRDFSVYRLIRSSWESAGDRLQLSYAPAFEGQQTFDGIILFLQKSKALMDCWLEMATSLLSEGGNIWLVGENGEGIKSWRKRLKNSFASVKNMDNARHCGLIEASEPLETVKEFSLPSYFTEFDCAVGERSLAVSSLPGVFSHGRLDVGTDVLLSTFDKEPFNKVPKGNVLDFGCGAGVVAGYLGLKQPEASFTLVDCDALALKSAEKTLKNNGINSSTVIASDGLSEVSGSYQMIVSNPPFHQGVKTHYAVTEQFLAESHSMLVKGGELRIVANSFLRYEPIITKAFGHCKTLVVQNGFSVYQAIKS